MILCVYVVGFYNALSDFWKVRMILRIFESKIALKMFTDINQICHRFVLSMSTNLRNIRLLPLFHFRNSMLDS